MKDLETFIDEVSAVMDKKTLLDLHHTATSEPYSLLNIKLTAKNKNEMFYQNFDKRLIIQDEYICSNLFVTSFNLLLGISSIFCIS